MHNKTRKWRRRRRRSTLEHTHTQKKEREFDLFDFVFISKVYWSHESMQHFLLLNEYCLLWLNPFSTKTNSKNALQIFLSFFHLLLILLLIPKSFVHRLVFPRKENPMKFDRLIIDIDLSYLILINNILHNWIRKYIVLPVLMTSLSFSLGFRGWKIRRKSLTRLSNDDSIYCDVF